jgi:uncharacterized cofD-like protein
VVALGGGHGLYASLTALRRITTRLTAVVTVADDGGSSGRLRRDLGVIPPGDLRMALAALCGDDEWGQTWKRVVQHRFGTEPPGESGDTGAFNLPPRKLPQDSGSTRGDLHGHAVGNLLIVALWELFGDPVAGLDWMGRLLRAQGRVLPMASVPLDIVADVRGADPAEPRAVTRVRGQVATALTAGQVVGVSLVPPDPPACPEAVEAVHEADWVVFGPGSWFTSVLPHLKVPALADALTGTGARRIVTLNLAPQPGETDDFSPQAHLDVLAEHAPGMRLDVVLADRGVVEEPEVLRKAVRALGGRLILADIAARDGSPRHDPERLAQAFAQIVAGGP